MKGSNVIAVRFPIGSAVTLLDADCRGRVKRIGIEGENIEYLVTWFDDERRKSEGWFNAEELGSVTTNEQTGRI